MFLQISFSERGLELPNGGISEDTWCTSIVARVKTPLFFTSKPGFSFFLFLFCLYKVSSYQVPAELSSTQQRTAARAQQSSEVRCRAALCWVLCCAVRRCAGCCAVLTLSCMPGLIRRSIMPQYTEVRRTRIVRTTWLNGKKCTPSSAQLSYSSAARSAAPCGGGGTVPGPTVRGCAVLRCAFFRTHSTRYHVEYQVSGATCTICIFGGSS